MCIVIIIIMIIIMIIAPQDECVAAGEHESRDRPAVEARPPERGQDRLSLSLYIYIHNTNDNNTNDSNNNYYLK